MAQGVQSSATLIRWLWKGYLRKYVGTLAVAGFFMTVEGSTLGALAYITQPMFDQAFVAGEKSALFSVGFVLIGIFAVRAISSVVQRVLLSRVAEKTAAEIRGDLLDRIMKQDGEFHQAHPPGYLIQRVQTDVRELNKVWTAIITGSGRDAIGLVVLLGVAISIDPIWALLACIGVPVMIMPAAFAQKFVRQRAGEARDLGASLAIRLDEIFHGVVQIKLNGAEDYQARQFQKLSKAYIRKQIRTVFGKASIPALVDIMSGFGFLAVILYGGLQIIDGEKTIGQFMSFFTAMGFAFNPMRRLANISGLWQVAAASVDRLKELMEAPITLTSPAHPMPPPAGIPDIVLEDVALRYGETEVLEKLSLTAAAGQTTALVGASGAGKSTVFNLLTRLIDPTEGTVRIGGVATTDMALPDLRGLFSVVSQEAILFDETLRENILMGRSDVGDDQLKAVLDAAHVSDFLPNLSDGLETEAGPRGSALSGGQRQRVVIARALLRDTPILLLDEATSALDAQSEKLVREALEELARGRTTLVIAHRLSTVRNADKIIVMDAGRVVDEGTHEELMKRDGIYANLYRLQFQDGKKVADTHVMAPEEIIEIEDDLADGF